MKQVSLFLLSFFFVLAFTACGGGEGDGKNGGQDSTAKNNPAPDKGGDNGAMTNGSLKVYKLEGSPAFADAGLEMTMPERGVSLAAGENKFNFNVTNYNLGEQSPGADGSNIASNGLANSGKGQHIHLILNNGPYSAHYEPGFEKVLKDGHYVCLAFLSRSWHESVKNESAFAVSQFVVGNPGEYKEADFKAPHMFYSRPKGTYYGAEKDKLLLDFFLVNTTLAADGNRVKATINGQEFTFTEWAPYVIEGLEYGEVTVRLQLLDKDNQQVPGPFNDVTRTVTLAEKKPNS